VKAVPLLSRDRAATWFPSPGAGPCRGRPRSLRLCPSPRRPVRMLQVNRPKLYIGARHTSFALESRPCCKVDRPDHAQEVALEAYSRLQSMLDIIGFPLLQTDSQKPYCVPCLERPVAAIDVVTAGKPSGTTSIASAVALRSACDSGVSRRNSQTKHYGRGQRLATDRCLPCQSICRCRGSGLTLYW
jgi:hypothetical protein